MQTLYKTWRKLWSPNSYRKDQLPISKPPKKVNDQTFQLFWLIWLTQELTRTVKGLTPSNYYIQKKLIELQLLVGACFYLLFCYSVTFQKLRLGVHFTGCIGWQRQNFKKSSFIHDCNAVKIVFKVNVVPPPTTRFGN